MTTPTFPGSSPTDPGSLSGPPKGLVKGKGRTESEHDTQSLQPSGGASSSGDRIHAPKLGLERVRPGIDATRKDRSGKLQTKEPRLTFSSALNFLSEQDNLPIGNPRPRSSYQLRSDGPPLPYSIRGGDLSTSYGPLTGSAPGRVSGSSPIVSSDRDVRENFPIRSKEDFTSYEEYSTNREEFENPREDLSFPEEELTAATTKSQQGPLADVDEEAVVLIHHSPPALAEGELDTSSKAPEVLIDSGTTGHISISPTLYWHLTKPAQGIGEISPNQKGHPAHTPNPPRKTLPQKFPRLPPKNKLKKKKPRSQQGTPVSHKVKSQEQGLECIRRLFATEENMADGDGADGGAQRTHFPSLRLPWFSGKTDERIDQYFRELENMKEIYGWTDPHSLAMALHGLRGRAADWVNTLGAAEKATFNDLKQAMKKIFGDRRAAWQKNKDFFGIRQGKDQTVLDYAGVLRQQQGKTNIGNDVLLAVFIDGLLPSISKTLAIMNPVSFEEAVEQATCLESLDKPRGGSKSLAAIETEDRDQDDKSMERLEEKLGAVLAALETADAWKRGQEAQGSRNDRGRGSFRGRGSWRGSRSGDRSEQPRETGTRSSSWSGGTGNERGRGRGQSSGRGSGQPGFTGRSEYGYDSQKYCVVHETYGHSTDACQWLKMKLRDMRPPTRQNRYQPASGQFHSPDSRTSNGQGN